MSPSAAHHDGPSLGAISQQEPGDATWRMILRAELGRLAMAWRRAMSSLSASLLLHAIVLVLLARWVISAPPAARLTALVAEQGTEPSTLESLEPVQFDGENLNRLDVNVDAEQVEQITSTSDGAGLDTTLFDETSAAASTATITSEVGLESPLEESLLQKIGSALGSDLSGRGEAARQGLLAQRGGTAGSEAAVALGLEWLAKHQRSDGSWNFDHRAGECRGQCDHPGEMTRCTTGATAMALLPFLGAGQTQFEGKYKQTIQAGLYYLVRRMQILNRKKNIGTFVEGAPMYDHGLATMALCEALAMTRDRELERPAQMAINYIVEAQDTAGGGWRYNPGQAGDTSQHGWQVMALKSGHLAYLQVPHATILGAVQFLDRMQSPESGLYGYTQPNNATRPGATGGDQQAATTAAALLCRMYLGWKRDHPSLEEGVAFLAQRGPSKADMYFNYYATQVLSHWEGIEWERWNRQMRDYLIDKQSKEGHTRGSWYLDEKGDEFDLGAVPGGRLYFTAMATMTLEVYYRHMPIYRQEAVEAEFLAPGP